MDLLEEYLLSLCMKVKLLIKYVFSSSKDLGLLASLMFCRRKGGMILEKQGSFCI